MKNIFLTVILSAISVVSFSQITDNESALRNKATSADTVDSWKLGGMTNLQFTNTRLYNWAAGGDNSIAINGMANLFANYKKGANVWDNSLALGYGIMRQGSAKLDDGKTARPFKKTDDKIELVSKYGRSATKNWYYAALLDFKTQMTDGKNYTNDTTYTVVSKALAPAYLSGGVGMDFKPDNYFSAYISPVTARLIIVNDQALADLGSFGVTAAEFDTAGNVIKHGEKLKTEVGGYVRLQYTRTEWNNEFMKNIGLTTKLNMFSNYLENPQNVDVDWETLITLKINKFISVSFNTHLLYDDDTKTIELDELGNEVVKGPKIQFKEILGIGFSCTF